MKRGRGQLDLSFGMIFSIFLIIVFLAFAFYVIKSFLTINEGAQVGSFVNDLQNDVDKAWKGFQSSELVTYDVPNAVEKVCVVNLAGKGIGSNANLFDELYRFSSDPSDNLFFYPFGDLQIKEAKLKNINLASITSNENPYCFSATNGKVSIKIVKDRNSQDNLVNLER